MDDFIIGLNSSILDALVKIDKNKKGFLIVLDTNGIVVGTLSDGDIRRQLINGSLMSDLIVANYSFKRLNIDDDFSRVCDLFKFDKIYFLPILDEISKLVNIITKEQFHYLLLHDKDFDLNIDFIDIDENKLKYEVYNRPWGFYKSTLLSDYVQSKIITVFPNEQLSLQEHKRREEHWVVIKGKGKVVLGESTLDIYPGRYIYIPKGCKHQIINNSNENIIFSEVQLGDYFGEDDIIRYSDKYGRAKGRVNEI